jgi:murein DD-endopeptidase MepM/ murein hydrolase activator NlpD
MINYGKNMAYPLKDWGKAKRGYKFGEKTFYSSHHLGTDVAMPEDTPVYAPKDGEIVIAGKFKQGGKTLHFEIFDSKMGNLIFRFMHLNKLMPKGKYKEGEIIGYTGNSGAYCLKPHLHLDISRQKVHIKNFTNFIDPEKYFKK